MRALYVTAAALAALATTAAVEEPYGYRGTKMGTGLAIWRADNPNGVCGKGEVAGATDCAIEQPPSRYGYEGLKYRFYPYGESSEPMLYAVNILSSNPVDTQMHDGLVGKWGEPAERSLQIEKWRRGGSTITYMRLGNGTSVTIALDSVVNGLDAAKKALAARQF